MAAYFVSALDPALRLSDMKSAREDPGCSELCALRISGACVPRPQRCGASNAGSDKVLERTIAWLGAAPTYVSE